MPHVKKSFRSNDKKTKLISFRYNEFLDGSSLDDLLESLKEVDVLTINDEEARQLSGEIFVSKSSKKDFSNGT